MIRSRVDNMFSARGVRQHSLLQPVQLHGNSHLFIYYSSSLTLPMKLRWRRHPRPQNPLRPATVNPHTRTCWRFIRGIDRATALLVFLGGCEDKKFFLGDDRELFRSHILVG